MDPRPIKTPEDHAEALREINRLWEAELGTREGDKLEVLAILVEDYENRSWPAKAASPLKVLEYAIAEMGRSQTELAEILGSRSQASDLLRGRRRLSVEAARKISRAWGIPIQLLISNYPEKEQKAVRKIRKAGVKATAKRRQAA